MRCPRITSFGGQCILREGHDGEHYTTFSELRKETT